MQNSNFIYLGENNTYILKTAVVYLQVLGDSPKKAKLCIGNGSTNYTLEFFTVEDAENRRLEILNALV